jgi:hypothetical protein
METINLKELQGDDLRGAELRGSLLAKNIKLRDTGFNSKTFHYWKMNGLLYFVEDGKWAQISFIEYLWLKVLESMQGFGCSLKLMKQIYTDQFLKAYEQDLNKITATDHIAFFKNLKKIRGLNDEEQKKLEVYENSLNDPFISLHLRTEISYFYQTVSQSINAGVESGFVIYPDETYSMFGSGKEIVDRDRPHIYIPLSHFIADLFVDKDKAEFVNQLKLFSEDEMRLVRELRSNNVERVTITYDKEARKVTKIEYDKTGLLNGDKAKEVMRILGMRNYSGIQLKTRTGTSLSFTKTETKFL